MMNIKPDMEGKHHIGVDHSVSECWSGAAELRQMSAVAHLVQKNSKITAKS